MRSVQGKSRRRAQSKGRAGVRGRRRPPHIEAWLADRRAGYRRDMVVQFLRGLPETVKWIGFTIFALTGGGAALAVARTLRGFAA